MEWLTLTTRCPKCRKKITYNIEDLGFVVPVEAFFHCQYCSVNIHLQYVIERKVTGSTARQLNIEEFEVQIPKYYPKKRGRKKKK